MEDKNRQQGKFKSASKWLYRRGLIFSAVMVVLSLINNLGTHIANKLGIGKGPETVAEAKKKLLPYEAPLFNVFGSVGVVSEAHANINMVT